MLTSSIARQKKMIYSENLVQISVLKIKLALKQISEMKKKNTIDTNQSMSLLSYFTFYLKLYK